MIVPPLPKLESGSWSVCIRRKAGKGNHVAEHENCIGETSEWYTPPEIFAALRLTFDLDPCSPGAGHWVPAKKIYTAVDDGLVQPWHGLVFMNPPFGGRNGHVVWLQKFFRHACGVAIVRAYTSSAWWHAEMHKAEMILFPRGKTKFVRPRWQHRHGARTRHRVGRHGRRRLRCAAAVWSRHGLGSTRSTEGRVMTRSETIAELQALIHERLFGPGRWLLDDEGMWAVSKRLEELGLLEFVEYDKWRITPLGRELELPLLDVFLGFDEYGETPMTLNEYGLMTEAEMDEVYDIYWATAFQHAEIIGIERDTSTSTETIMRPYARRAFLKYFKLDGAAN